MPVQFDSDFAQQELMMLAPIMEIFFAILMTFGSSIETKIGVFITQTSIDWIIKG